MKSLDLSKVNGYVESHISTFHQKRLDKIKELKLNEVLKKKNPYLFKAKNILTTQDLVKSILDTYLSSQEETLFGEFIEGLQFLFVMRFMEQKNLCLSELIWSLKKMKFITS